MMLTFLKSLRNKTDNFLDHYILPWPVRFVTARFIILLTIALLIPLIIFDKNTTFVLVTNSYLNVMSVAVSSIVLLYETISEARQKQIAAMQEKRAMEDHMHVTEMHKLIMQTLTVQCQELEDLKVLMSKVTGTQNKAMEIPECPEAQSMHPLGNERFVQENVSERLEAALHQNQLITEIQKDLQPINSKKNGS